MLNRIGALRVQEQSAAARALAQRGVPAPSFEPALAGVPGERRRVDYVLRRQGRRVLAGFHERASPRLVDIAECGVVRPVLAGLSRKSMIWRTLGITPEGALNGTTVLNTIALLREHWTESGRQFGGIMHCFSEGPREAEEALALGFYISFAGVVTFPKAAAIQEAGVTCVTINKVAEGRPHIVDMIKNNEVILVINTVEERRNAIADSRYIRTSALLNRVTTFTTIAGAEAAVEGMKYMDNLGVISVQDMHAQLSA